MSMSPFDHLETPSAESSHQPHLVESEPKRLLADERRRQPLGRFAQVCWGSAALVFTACYALSDKLTPLLTPPSSSERWRYLALLSLLAIGVVCATLELCKALFRDYAAQRQTAVQLCESLTGRQACGLAVLAAVAEECLLRGAMPPLFGLSILGLVLAVVQVVSKGQLTVFLVMSLILSLTLSVIMAYSHSLYPGLLAHVAINLGLLCHLRPRPHTG